MATTTVTTYQLAYLTSSQTRLCSDCVADYDADGATRLAMGALGAVLHGRHEDDCDGCEIRIAVVEAVDGHLLGIGARIAADSDAAAIVGEDSWQTPGDLDDRFSAREWRDIVRAEIARRIEEARVERATTSQADAFVAAQLDAGADGSAWSDALEAAAEQAGGRRRSVGYELSRVEFADGSAIALCGPGAAWDVAVGAGDCTCWVSAQRGEHHEDCPFAR